jgi:membrane protein YdbS with pleckstrin-like domain
MKDILVTVKRQKTELKCLAASFLLVCLANVYAIIHFSTPWSELWTQTVRVLILTVLIYAITVVIRLVIYLINHYAIKKIQANKRLE